MPHRRGLKENRPAVSYCKVLHTLQLLDDFFQLLFLCAVKHRRKLRVKRVDLLVCERSVPFSLNGALQNCAHQFPFPLSVEGCREPLCLFHPIFSAVVCLKICKIFHKHLTVYLMRGTDFLRPSYHDGMQLLLIFILLSMTGKSSDELKETLSSALSFYRENRELIAMLVQAGEKAPANGQEKQPAETQAVKDLFEKFMNG